MTKTEKMAALHQEAIAKGFAWGSILVAEKGEILYEGCYGTANPKTGAQTNVDTVFELASVSKQFTAAAVMRLVEQGRLELDAPVETYVQDFPYEGITIRRLLNHTNGLPDYMEWVAKYGMEHHTIPSNDIIPVFLREAKLPRLFAPGEELSYCNTAYALLAHIIDLVTGSYRDYLKKELFEPAGMMHTQVYHRRRDGVTIENYAYGEVLEDGEWKLPDDTREDCMVIPLDGIEGDGVVNTIPRDLLLWDRALRAGQPVSLEGQKLMYTPTVLNDGTVTGYGFGWIIENTPVGMEVRHSGGWPGYHTDFRRFIDRDVVVIVLNNRAALDNEGITRLLDGLCAIALDIEPLPLMSGEELKAQAGDLSSWAPLCGQFEGDMSVRLEDGALLLHLCLRHEMELDLPLLPLHGDTLRLFGVGMDVRLTPEGFYCPLELFSKHLYRRIG